MNRLLISLPALFLLHMNFFGQEFTRGFEIEIHENKVPNSLYSSIKFIDSRIDTSNMGVVQIGPMNNKAKVILEIPFLLQFEKVINSLTDSTSKNGELLFQLRHLVFSELTGTVGEKGYCYIRAILYSKKDCTYYQLASVDTIALIKSMDVTKSLFRTGSKIITDLITSNLLKVAHDSVCYSYNNIMKIDSIEKRKIKIYNTDNYTDGLYYNYTSFKEQIPDKEIFVKTKKDMSISVVKILDNRNNLVKVNPNEVYSIIYQGKIYIATDFGYFPVYKNDDRFYFIGKVKASANSNDVIAASVLFGIVGGLIASSNASANYFIIIDHTNGGFINMKEMK